MLSRGFCVGQANEGLRKRESGESKTHYPRRVVVTRQKRASYTTTGAAAARHYVRQKAYPTIYCGKRAAPPRACRKRQSGKPVKTLSRSVLSCIGQPRDSGAYSESCHMDSHWAGVTTDVQRRPTLRRMSSAHRFAARRSPRRAWRQDPLSGCSPLTAG